jgi:hypothetical protein
MQTDSHKYESPAGFVPSGSASESACNGLGADGAQLQGPESRLGQPSSFGVLETIVDEIIKHDEEHPDHEAGCACLDKHAGAIRRMLHTRMLNTPRLEKSLYNLFAVIGYVTRNP